MKKFESQNTQSRLTGDEGWLVQLYGRDRRLLCVLEPSHGWSFLVGCGLGLVIAVIWVNAARYHPPVEPQSPTELPQLQID